MANAIGWSRWESLVTRQIPKGKRKPALKFKRELNEMSPSGVLVLVLIAIWTIIGYAIGSKKGRPQAGLFLGLFLGIIGIIIIACMSPTHDELVRQQREKNQIEMEARRWN